MKTYAFKELTLATLAEIAVLGYEPDQPAVWEELARRELPELDRTALGFLVKTLISYKTHRVNEATIWARAIYPLLVLTERGDIRAWSEVPLAARFDDVELRGEADGALAASINEEVGLPDLVVVEAKRGLGGTDPMDQLLGAMLCAARANQQAGRPGVEIFGCYTVADVWTFLRGTLDWTEPKPSMRVLSSREYTEKTEASAILSILESIVARVAR